MVPTKESCGRSGSFGLGRAATLGAKTGATAGAGGRRDGEKIGRSRVAENWASGMAQSGLALSARSAVGAAGAGGTTTCTTAAAGSVQPDAAANPARALSA